MRSPFTVPAAPAGSPGKVDVSQCYSAHSWRNKVARQLWSVVWLFLFRPTPKWLHGWRRFLLRSFGAKIGRGTFPFPSAKIWAPWNLEIGDHCALADHVDCYCVDKIVIGSNVTVSQYSFLCTASHDYEDPHMALITAPITIGDGAWVTADVFIGPGVNVGEGAVIAARASVFRDVPPWTVVAGNPAKVIKQRTLRAPGGKLAA
ncbi:MAG TPA: putative colanic acid biosynthesis acetyltransferase [Candidatus Dormibacteraeota bacterium]|nr:putative colanic acid biosynthesis acetyltransferase [Candidatus Dormibacteraeota bacterium]